MDTRPQLPVRILSPWALMMVMPMTVASVRVELDAHCGMVKTNTMSTARKTQLRLGADHGHVLAVALGEDAAR